jgi:hypothetical protein
MKRALLLVAVACLPCIASAEVMDKEPSLAALWGRAVALGVVGFLAWRVHWALGAAASSIAMVIVGSFLWELNDPYIGPAIRDEAG